MPCEHSSYLIVKSRCSIAELGPRQDAGAVEELDVLVHGLLEGRRLGALLIFDREQTDARTAAIASGVSGWWAAAAYRSVIAHTSSRYGPWTFSLSTIARYAPGARASRKRGSTSPGSIQCRLAPHAINP